MAEIEDRKTDGRHAVLITAYKDMDLLHDILKVYCEKFQFDCYVHIDKRTKVSTQTIAKLKSVGNVVILVKYRVKWGSCYHPMAYMALLETAIKRGGYNFYHCISANTFIGKNRKEFYDFFEAYKENNFMEIISFKGTESEESLSEWFRYYHYPFLYDKKGKFSRFWDYFEMYYVRLQKKLGIIRKVDFAYKGYIYCHINHSFAVYCLEWIKNNRNYIRELKYCHVCEEFFFQNIIMNSPYADSVISDSLIFDDWAADRERPALLNENDYEEYLKSGKIFLRKIETPASMKLYGMLKMKI